MTGTGSAKAIDRFCSVSRAQVEQRYALAAALR
jgi:hypothetical protein